MLDKKEYEKLWDENFAPLTTQAMPPYKEYVIRENMVEDYLDIFRGESTRKERSSIEGIDWYYPHPFFNEDGTPKLEKKPCIKYIMIAEAPPPLRTSRPTAAKCLIPGGDTGNTYFYNILHIGNTPYLNAPMIAFGSPDYKPCPENKINTLLDLASKGVFLIDFYPFPIPTAIRRIIPIAPFYDDLLRRLDLLCPLYCKEINFALMAVKVTSERIINHSVSKGKGGLIVCKALYPLDDLTNDGTIDNFYNWTLANTSLIMNTAFPPIGNYHLIIPPCIIVIPLAIISTGAIISKNLIQVHKFRKLAIVRNGRLYVPDPILLAFAFNL